MTTRTTGPYIGGKSYETKTTHSVRNPYDGSVVGEVGQADASILELAIQGAAAAFKSWSGSATHERALVLEKLALLIEAEQSELARLISCESGKPIRYA